MTTEERLEIVTDLFLDGDIDMEQLVRHTKAIRKLKSVSVETEEE